MRNRNTGFTLVELLITVALVAIVLGLGVPSFQSTVLNNRLTTQANALVAGLQFARSEAVKRSRRVTVCRSADGTSCAASGGWDQGWIVFLDADDDGDWDAGEDILRVNEALVGTGQSLVGSADVAQYISFASTGVPRKPDGTAQSGTLFLCDSRGSDYSRTVTLSQTGKASAAKADSCAPA